MKLLRNLIASAALAALAASSIAPAFAQAGPSSTAVFYPGVYRTYSASIKGLAPAASATDFFTITGAAGRTVKVTRASCNGSSTAAGNTVVTALKRSTANSAGTSTAPTITPLNSGNLAPLAVVRAYTANPTTGTLVGNLDNQTLFTQAASSPSGAAPTLAFNFPWETSTISQPVMLNSATEVFALNAGGTSFPAGASLNCTVVWTEQ